MARMIMSCRYNKQTMQANKQTNWKTVRKLRKLKFDTETVTLGDIPKLDFLLTIV